MYHMVTFTKISLTHRSVIMSEQVWLRKHTRREFRERMNAGELKLCIIPIAAIEQHLEHMEMEHDWRSVCHIAGAVAERLVVAVEGLVQSAVEYQRGVEPNGANRGPPPLVTHVDGD